MPDLDQISERATATAGELTRVLEDLRSSGQPIILSVNGRGKLTVVDDESYRHLLQLVDRLEVVEDIRESLKELDEGRGLTLEQAKDHVRKAHGISL